MSSLSCCSEAITHVPARSLARPWTHGRPPRPSQPQHLRPSPQRASPPWTLRAGSSASAAPSPPCRHQHRATASMDRALRWYAVRRLAWPPRRASAGCLDVVRCLGPLSYPPSVVGSEVHRLPHLQDRVQCFLVLRDSEPTPFLPDHCGNASNEGPALFVRSGEVVGEPLVGIEDGLAVLAVRDQRQARLAVHHQLGGAACCFIPGGQNGAVSHAAPVL